jgi:transcriptional regulator with XRE-family HTH domain
MIQAVIGFCMHEETIKKATGEKIRERRAVLDISQKTLADKVGLSRASIANIERGAQAIDIVQLFLFAEKLSTQPSSLLPDFISDPFRDLPDNIRSLVKGVIKEAKYG